MQRLVRAQIVQSDLATVFAFFKDPWNLETITPPWLRFRVLDASHAEVREGTRIVYRLHLHAFPLRWESRITEFEVNHTFVDEMVRGPYRRWYHRHRFRSVPGGVEIADEVEYALPLGPLGRLVHALVVRRQLDAIFAYRHARIAERFGDASVSPPVAGDRHGRRLTTSSR